LAPLARDRDTYRRLEACGEGGEYVCAVTPACAARSGDLSLRAALDDQHVRIRVVPRQIEGPRHTPELTMTEYVPRTPRLLLTLALTAALGACAEKTPDPTADSTPAAEPMTASEPQTVPTVDSIRCSITASPASLVVTVDGEVNTGGWTSPTLAPRTYVAPPTDGIWEYDFRAVPPSGMATQALSPISASHTWADYPAAGLKGIRVFGVDAGVKEIPITACTSS
jgi:hypothetical protein